MIYQIICRFEIFIFIIFFLHISVPFITVQILLRGADQGVTEDIYKLVKEQRKPDSCLVLVLQFVGCSVAYKSSEFNMNIYVKVATFRTEQRVHLSIGVV